MNNVHSAHPFPTGTDRGKRLEFSYMESPWFSGKHFLTIVYTNFTFRFMWTCAHKSSHTLHVSVRVDGTTMVEEWISWATYLRRAASIITIHFEPFPITKTSNKANTVPSLLGARRTITTILESISGTGHRIMGRISKNHVLKRTA